MFFFFNDTSTSEIYTLSLHDALPICVPRRVDGGAHAGIFGQESRSQGNEIGSAGNVSAPVFDPRANRFVRPQDRKSTRLNSSHLGISYAVFCLKKKKNQKNQNSIQHT